MIGGSFALVEEEQDNVLGKCGYQSISVSRFDNEDQSLVSKFSLYGKSHANASLVFDVIILFQSPADFTNTRTTNCRRKVRSVGADKFRFKRFELQ